MTASRSDATRPGTDAARPARTFHHDWTSGEPLSTAIVDAIATLSDGDPTHVPLLYDRLDPDALDALFRPRERGATRSDGHLWFRLGEYGVSVFGDGRVVVRHLE